MVSKIEILERGRDSLGRNALFDDVALRDIQKAERDYWKTRKFIIMGTNKDNVITFHRPTNSSVFSCLVASPC